MDFMSIHDIPTMLIHEIQDSPKDASANQQAHARENITITNNYIRLSHENLYMSSPTVNDSSGFLNKWLCLKAVIFYPFLKEKTECKTINIMVVACSYCC